MDGTWGYYAKWNKSDRERQIYDFTHIWNIKNKINEQAKPNKKQKQTHRSENRLVVTRGERVGRAGWNG